MALLVVALMASSAAYANLGFGSSNWGMSRSKNMSLSVFMAVDKQSDESGYGVSLTQNGTQPIELSYVSLDTFRLYQFSQTTPKQFSGFKVNFGFAAAYADPIENVPDEGTPENLYTGLTLSLARTEMAYGLALDVRATSLSKDFDPIAWFSDPDILWLGAGLSYAF